MDFQRRRAAATIHTILPRVQGANIRSQLRTCKGGHFLSSQEVLNRVRSRRRGLGEPQGGWGMQPSAQSPGQSGSGATSERDARHRSDGSSPAPYPAKYLLTAGRVPKITLRRKIGEETDAKVGGPDGRPGVAVSSGRLTKCSISIQGG